MNINQYLPEENTEMLTMEEREDREMQERIKRCRFDFHSDISYDRALERAEDFDSTEPFIPGIEKKAGERRIYIRVYERYFMRNSSYASLTAIIEESERFGVDITAIVSGGGNGIFNLNSGTHGDYTRDFMRHMGAELPKESFAKKAGRFLFE